MYDRDRAINLMFKTFIRAKSKKDFLDQVIKLIKKWSTCHQVGIRLLDAVGYLPYESYIGFSKDFWEKENALNINKDDCICTRVITGDWDQEGTKLLTKEGTFSCSDTDRLLGDKMRPLRGTCLLYGYKTLLVIPIKKAEITCGVIHIADQKANKICMETISFLEHIAGFIGEAVQKFALEENLKKSEASLAKAQKIAAMGNYELDLNFTKNNIWWSKELNQILGMKKQDEQPNLQDFLQHIHFDDLEAYMEKLKECVQTRKAVSLEHRIIKDNEEIRFVKQQIEPVFDENGKIIHAFGIIQDITQQKLTEEELFHLATHDQLTKIPNRHLLKKHILDALQNAKKTIQSYFLLINIDKFKQINESLGHDIGDEILKAIAKVIQEAIRAEDYVFRYGGDEFAVILNNIDQDLAYHQAEKIRVAVFETDYIESPIKEMLDITVSIGMVGINEQAKEHQVLTLADNAVYKAKQMGRNTTVFVDSDDDILFKISKINETIHLLRNALNNYGLLLYAQSILDIQEKKPVSYEILLRLLDQNGKVISPANFIPIAEKYGLIPQLDQWVVRKVFGLMKRYPDKGFFINLSGLSIGDGDLLQVIKEGIEQNKIDPSRICFEITETAALRDILKARRWIIQIKDLGCKFALDDFGTGFSSFAYLRLLPVDYVKIDASILYNIHKNPVNYALTKAINEVAHTLKKKTIAEGIEIKESIKALEELGIDYGQGYYFGRPEKID